MKILIFKELTECKWIEITITFITKLYEKVRNGKVKVLYGKGIINYESNEIKHIRQLHNLHSHNSSASVTHQITPKSAI